MGDERHLVIHQRRPESPKEELSEYAWRVYRWCQADVGRAAQVSRAEVGAMIDGNERILSYVEEVINTRQHMESVFDAIYVGKEDKGTRQGYSPCCSTQLCVQPWSCCASGQR